MLASVYARSGRKTDALRLVDAALARSTQTYVAPSSMALAYIGLGEPDRAIEWLEKAYEDRDHALVTLKGDPAYASLHDNPKFVALLKKMKLQPRAESILDNVMPAPDG